MRPTCHALLIVVSILATGCEKKEAPDPPAASTPPTPMPEPAPVGTPATMPRRAPVEPPAPARRCLQEALASFPWPDVPRPTAQRVLVRDLFQPAPPPTLGALLAQLRRQVVAAGYPAPPVLGAGCNGFALVLEGEKIRPDGRRLGFEHWGQTSGVSVAEILRQLFTAAPGMYRMIVVVVSTERARVTGEAISAQDLAALGAQGSSELPAAMAALPFDPSYEVRALVYEFVKDVDTAAQVPPDGRVPVVAHLRQAGLLPREPR